MPHMKAFGLFLTAAFLLAITPGPGIFYVLARSLKGGRRDGMASTAGTALGGFFHVVAAALGLSAILATSAVAFSVVKYAGAAYLVFLGMRILLVRENKVLALAVTQETSRRICFQGVLTEMLNPKTALFFLAFIPQFVDPGGPVVLQFVMLGTISVLLNSAADIVVTLFAGPIGQALKTNVRLRTGQRFVSGGALVALGVFVAVSGEK